MLNGEIQRDGSSLLFVCIDLQHTRIAVEFAGLENSNGQMRRLYADVANKYALIQDSEQNKYLQA